MLIWVESESIPLSRRPKPCPPYQRLLMVPTLLDKVGPTRPIKSYKTNDPNDFLFINFVTSKKKKKNHQQLNKEIEIW